MLLTTRLFTPEDARGVAPRLFIEHGAWLTLQRYVGISPVEINGFAYVSLFGTGFQVKSAEDVFITRQTVDIASAHVDGRTFARAVDRAAQADRQDQLRLQWHSHVNGDAYFSATDLGTINSYGPAGMEWFLSVVMNKRGEIRARVDQFLPFRTGCEIAVEVYSLDGEASQDAAQQEFDQLVTVRERQFDDEDDNFEALLYRRPAPVTRIHP